MGLIKGDTGSLDYSSYGEVPSANFGEGRPPGGGVLV